MPTHPMERSMLALLYNCAGCNKIRKHDTCTGQHQAHKQQRSATHTLLTQSTTCPPPHTCAPHKFTQPLGPPTGLLPTCFVTYPGLSLVLYPGPNRQSTISKHACVPCQHQQTWSTTCVPCQHLKHATPKHACVPCQHRANMEHHLPTPTHLCPH